MIDSIRIKANLDQDNSNLTINLPHTFDFLEVLSLKLSSEEIYKLHNASYGVLVGRVTTNGGFGIPNARVSVFVPITDADNTNVFLKSYYNYKTPYDKNSNGVRYNLLPKEKQFLCHAPVGTFPEKNEILNTDVWIEVYEKYYKYNAVTNQSGDYMIVGVPIGNQTIHMDADLSDLGYVSLKPYDLIAQGASSNTFISNNRFNVSKDLDSLSHIQTSNQTVEVVPFWGDSSINNIGISQLNFNLSVDITPHAIFFGGSHTDTEGKKISKRCNPSNDIGENCSLRPSSGQIEMIRKASDYSDTLEYHQINGNIDVTGNFNVLVPMNLNRVITDEAGNLTPSPNPSQGIPTRAKVRFRVTSEAFSYKFFKGTSRAGSFLIPNMYNRFQFGADTNLDDLFELKWKKIYTVSQYIPRFSKKSNDSNNGFLGIKNIKSCDNNYSFPYNRIATSFNFLFPITIIFVLLNTIKIIVNAINLLIINKDNELKLSCGDGSDPKSPNDWYDCVLQSLAESSGAIRYQFYNDWVSGSLYSPMFSYSVKYKNGQKSWERYCDFDCNKPKPNVNYKNKCKQSYIVESTQFNGENNPIESIYRGIIHAQDGFYYYVARSDVGMNPINSKPLFPNQKSKLLFATNLMELGSSLKCDIDSIPYIIKQFVPTTYNESEQADVLLNINALTPNHFNRNAIMLISQLSVEQYSEIYNYELIGNRNNLPEHDANTSGKTHPVAFSRTNVAIREYLCKNWKYYNNNLTYNSYVNDDTDLAYFKEFDDEVDPQVPEEVAEFIYDECIPCTDQSNPSERIHPYYFYFGLIKGQNSFDTLIKNYFNDCD